MLLAAAATTAAAPWWGTGAFTLAGGIVVAGLGQLFNIYNNRRKTDAEKKSYEQTMRRESLIAFMAAAHDAGAAGSGAASTEKLFALTSSFTRLQLAQLPEDIEEKAKTYAGAITAGALDPRLSDIGPVIQDMQANLVEAVRTNVDAFGLPKRS
jgi:hypothetical protein